MPISLVAGSSCQQPPRRRDPGLWAASLGEGRHALRHLRWV